MNDLETSDLASGLTKASWRQHCRNAIATHCYFMHAYQAHIGYSQQRPVPDIGQSMNGMRKLFDGGFMWDTDCSGAIEWAFKWSGMRSPTGYPYGGWGTQAMWLYNQLRFDKSENAHTGTIGVYGVQGDEHGVIVMRPGPTHELTTVFSHGEAGEARLISLADEDTAHVGSPFTFLSIEHLFPSMPSVKMSV